MAKAVELLEERTGKIAAVSSLYRTEPVDAPPQPWFLNAVVQTCNVLHAEDLLQVCRSVEKLLGRVRSIWHGPRSIDLDLLLVGDEIEETEELTLPHPQLGNRRFVLVPLVEIAPARIHPGLGLTMAELLRRCPDRATVERVAAPPWS
jgi:2-amino-4-hydroxy-6-hydroxymethyldihydropteridine diphosphokinase